MFLLFIYKGNGDVSLGVQGWQGGLGTVNEHISIPIYRCIQKRFFLFFFLFLLRIRRLSKPMLLLLRCRDGNKTHLLQRSISRARCGTRVSVV